jgi:hypothetical protein
VKGNKKYFIPYDKIRAMYGAVIKGKDKAVP